MTLVLSRASCILIAYSPYMSTCFTFRVYTDHVVTDCGISIVTDMLLWSGRSISLSLCEEYSFLTGIITHAFTKSVLYDQFVWLCGKLGVRQQLQMECLADWYFSDLINDNIVRWMPWNLTNDALRFAQVMAWSPCWFCSTINNVTRPQWVIRNRIPEY